MEQLELDLEVLEFYLKNDVKKYREEGIVRSKRI